MDNRKKIIVVIAVIIGIAIIGGIAALVSQNTQKSGEAQRDAKSYVDPVSGETVQTGNGTPITDKNITPDQPLYLGFASLVNRGLSIEQVNIVEQALTSYSLNNKAIFQQVSLDKDAITRVLQSSPDDPSVLTFPIVVNKKDNYFVSVSYSDPSSITTKLYKADRTTLLYPE